jgi:acylphosphatase
MDTTDISFNIRVQGRVQGVGYRRFAQRVAAECKIKGWARNLYNGEVEIFAQGTTEDLETYIGRLRKGPLMARVENVMTKKMKNEKHDGFIILPDGAAE